MMNRRYLTVLISVFGVVILLGNTSAAFALRDAQPASQAARLPQITFLGNGPGTFTLEPPLTFLVKTYRNNQFVFVTVDPPTYTAVEKERVWSINTMPAQSIRFFHDGRSYGRVEAGCVVDYVQIEDNVDARRNHFYLDGELLHTIEQGMVTYGTFTVPQAGELTFFANDSVGLIVDLCQSTVVEPPPGNEPTSTPETPPVIPTSTPTSPPEETPVVPTSTPAGEETPAVVTVTPDAPPPPPPGQTAGEEQTPVPTPPEIPLSGGEPGPREIGWMGAGLLATLGLVVAAWWRLLRWMRDGK